MSYTVDGLRHTISMSSGQGYDVLILIGFFVGFSLLTLLHYVRNAGRTSTMDFKDEEQTPKHGAE